MKKNTRDFQQYKFGGKELITANGFNEYDFGARRYIKAYITKNVYVTSRFTHKIIRAGRDWKIFVSLMLLCLFFLTSCRWETKNFYVEEVDKHIEIEKINDHEFRVYIYDADSTRNDNFIDLNYKLRDTNTIHLFFPLDDTDKIYIYDAWRDVKRISFSNFEYTLLVLPRVENRELMSASKYRETERIRLFIDSLDASPCIRVRIEGYLNSLSVWNENKKGHGVDPNLK